MLTGKGLVNFSFQEVICKRMHNYVIGSPLLVNLIQCMAFIEPPNDSSAAIAYPSLQVTPQSQESDNVFVNKVSLEKLCDSFDIPENNCTCERFGDYCPETQRNISTINRFACSNDLVQASVRVISSALGLLGNGFVIYVIFKLRAELTQFKKVILALSVADCVFSVITLVQGIPLFWACTWELGDVGCKTFRGLESASSVMAFGFIVMIAAERYYGIVKTMQESFVEKRFYLLIFINMIYAFVTTLPVLIFSKINNIGICEEIWDVRSLSLVYSWLFLVVTFFLPVVMISWLYYQCTKTMKERLKNSFICNKGNKSACIKGTKNMTKYVFMVLGTFCLLVGPNKIVWVLSMYIDFSKKGLERRITDYIRLFPYMFHVCMNPIIYAISDKRFRRASLI